MGRGGFLLAQEHADSLGCLRAANQLCCGGGQFGGALEGGQGDEDDDGQEYLGQDTRRGLRNADEECADDGCTHRAHVEGTGQG